MPILDFPSMYAPALKYGTFSCNEEVRLNAVVVSLVGSCTHGYYGVFSSEYNSLKNKKIDDKIQKGWNKNLP